MALSDPLSHVAQNYYAFNLPLFELVNGYAPHWDWFWENVTFLGDGLPAAVLLIFFCRRHAHLLWLGVLAALITGLGLQICKHVLDFLRPAGLLGAEHIHVIGKTLNHHSFPSGHSATAFVLACVLSEYAKQDLIPPYARTVQILLVVMAGLIAWSRVVVGAHWPTDVILGGIWGWYSGKLILWLSVRTADIGRTRLSANILYGIGAIACAIILTFDGGYPLAQPLATMLGLFALVFLANTMLERSGVRITRISTRFRDAVQAIGYRA